MTFDELQNRYGKHVSQRLRRELSSAELQSVSIDALPKWLETRAESAHEEYLNLLNGHLGKPSGKDAERSGEACHRWREAEDLAYIVVVAEDVGMNALATVLA